MGIFFLLAGILAIQSAGTPPSTRPSISVTISTPSAVVKLGSELAIKMVITNKSDHEMLLGKPAGKPGQGEFLNLIEVRDEHGNAVGKTKYYRQIRGEEFVDGGISVSVSSFRVKPGESVEEEVLVNKLYNIDKAGKYTIQVQHDDPETKALVKSNTITVIVTP